MIANISEKYNCQWFWQLDRHLPQLALVTVGSASATTVTTVFAVGCSTMWSYQQQLSFFLSPSLSRSFALSLSIPLSGIGLHGQNVKRTSASLMCQFLYTYLHIFRFYIFQSVFIPSIRSPFYFYIFIYLLWDGRLSLRVTSIPACKGSATSAEATAAAIIYFFLR